MAKTGYSILCSPPRDYGFNCDITCFRIQQVSDSSDENEANKAKTYLQYHIIKKSHGLREKKRTGAGQE